MSSFIIEGGHRLSGAITPQGAKNEALQIISATLLSDRPVHVTNIPEISDVVNLIALLEAMGVTVERHAKGDYTFTAADINPAYLESDDFTRRCAALRGSVLVVGPLLTRLGRASFAKPGGDKIGRRKVDTHIQGLMNLGAQLGYDDSRHAYLLSTPAPRDLKGTYMLLDEASVTGTANIIMAATMAHGDTTIYNAACEPYLQQLCRLLTAMGARIDGIGSNLVTVHGSSGSLLGGASHRVLPDMIEIGSFIGMAAITRSDLTIRDVSVADLGIIPESFRRLGIDIEVIGDDLHIPAKESYVIEKALDGTVLTLADAPWPGLSPDLLSVMLVTATQCSGAVLIHQKMFESRLFFVDHLIEMGAQIILCDPHRAVVIGLDHKTDLHPNFMKSPDIRAGIAMLLAAMSTPGRSVIGDIEQIDRGYEHIDTRLNALGARITRQP